MAAQQPQGGEADNSLAALWITLGLFILAGFIWHFFKNEIINTVFMLRSMEADVIKLFLPAGWTESLTKAQSFMQQAQAGGDAGVTFGQLLQLSNNVGSYLRYPVALILLMFAILLYISNVTFKYKKTYDMNRLLRQEEFLWPQVAPVASLDLLHTDIDKGPWAMSMQPMAFAKKHNLLIVEKIIPSDAPLQTKAISIANVKRDEARRAFALQIGAYWASPQALPIHMRALFACCAGRIEGDRDGPAKVLEQISESTRHGKLNFSGVDALLQKHQNSKIVAKVTQQHAFVLTVMASMLEAAREDGVFPSSDFLWLKPVDRRLWYMLNSVGRQTSFAEVSGPFAHWIAEKEFGRKLNVPMVEEAVNGLAAAMKEIIYKEDEGG